MRHALKIVATVVASASLVTSTTAIAAAPAPAPQAPAAKLAQPLQPNPWVMLAALDPATRPIVQGGAVVAAQPAPPPPAYAAAARTGEVLPFFLWFGLIIIALTIAGSSGGKAAPGPTPNSPG